MNTKQKFQRIDQSKLDEKQVGILKAISQKTNDFKTKDKEILEKIDLALDKIIAALEEKNPEALKPINAKKSTSKPKAKTSKATSKSAPSKPTAMSLAKEIRRADETWNEAVKRASEIMKNNKAQAKKTIDTELQKLLKIVRTRKELEGFKDSDILRDSVRTAKPRGKRVVTKQGFTSNQYGTFENRIGRKYWESRDGHADRLSPAYPKDLPLLENGGNLSSSNFSISTEKATYTNGESTYGAKLLYKDKLFKFFVIIPNTTKSEAIKNVKNYIKTLSVSENIDENSPEKGNFSVYYNDRGGEHRYISNSKSDVERFIKDVKRLKQNFADGGMFNTNVHSGTAFMDNAYFADGGAIKELKEEIEYVKNDNSISEEERTKYISELKLEINRLKGNINLLDKISNGNKVKTTSGETFYVIREYSDDYFWVTKNKKDRFNKNASGYTLPKLDVVEVLDEFEDGGMFNTNVHSGTAFMDNAYFADGGSVTNLIRMYNFLKDDLVKLEEAIKSGDFEEVNRFFSYWLGSSGHLKSLETPNNQRMYNFLKEDLEELMEAVEDGDIEEVERFFSYWSQHLESLKMASGGGVDKSVKVKLTKDRIKSKLYKPSGDFFIEDKGDKYILHFTPKDAYANHSNLVSMNAEDAGNGYYGSAYSVNKVLEMKYAEGGEFMTDPNFGNFQNTVLAHGGGVKNSYSDWESEVANELSKKLEIDYSDAQSIIEANDFYMAQSWGKGLNPVETANLIDEKSKYANGGSLNDAPFEVFVFKSKLRFDNELPSSSKGDFPTFAKAKEFAIDMIDSGNYYATIMNKSGNLWGVSSKGVESFELGGNVMPDLAGHMGGKFGTGDPSMLNGFTGTHYDGLVGETGAMSAGELFMDGGVMMQNQAIIDAASQPYVNYYLGEGASAGMFKRGGQLKQQPSIKQLFIEEIASLTGTRVAAIEDFVSQEGLTEYEVASLAQALGTKKIKSSDFLVLIVGDKTTSGYKKTKSEVMKIIKSGKVFSSIPKKYIDHDDIAYVNVMKGGKQVSYKGSDVFNGVNTFDDGGKLSSKANYISKRDVVSVTLKNGETVTPANGYWVKKGAEVVNSPKKSSDDIENFKIGDYVKRTIKEGGIVHGSQGFIYEINQPFSEIRLEDDYGNKSPKWYKIKGFRKLKSKSKKSFADGGLLNSTQIEKLDNGFTISQLNGMLQEMFPDSFSLEVYEQKQSSNFRDRLHYESENKVNDDKLKLYFHLEGYGRDLNYAVYQGQENTYFKFQLLDNNINTYVGTFGFKDRGDVDSSYITKFVSFLQDAYHYPLTAKHFVMANGGSFREKNEGFMEIDNERKFRSPFFNDEVEPVDIPMDLSSDYIGRKPLEDGLEEEIDLSEGRIRAIKTFSAGSPDKLLAVNPNAYEYLNLPKPDGKTHKND